MLHSGVSPDHKMFWQKKSPDNIYVLHSQHCSYSPDKVIALLDSSDAVRPAEEHIYDYLRLMLGNMRSSELKLFLRFVTGSRVCITSKIVVTFNNMTGLGCRPIAHTCDATIELPISYANYDDFLSDFKAILNSTEEELSWEMDCL